MDKKVVKIQKSKLLWTIGFAMIVIAVSIMLGLIFQENVTVSSSGTAMESNTTLECVQESKNYPIFTFARYDSSETKIDLLFANNELKTVGLKQNLYYASEEGANMSNANNHAAMNFAFQDDGMIPDSLGAAYVVSGKRFGMSLFADALTLNEKAAKYFLLEGRLLGATVNQYVDHYEGMGFICTLTE